MAKKKRKKTTKATAKGKRSGRKAGKQVKGVSRMADPCEGGESR